MAKTGNTIPKLLKDFFLVLVISFEFLLEIATDWKTIQRDLKPFSRGLSFDLEGLPK
jgi:hypothetical protein